MIIFKITETATILIIAGLFATQCVKSASAAEVTPSSGGPGQVIEDNSGNMFMEEVVDENKWQEEEAQRKKKSNLERRRLTEKELIDNGLQVTPSGNLIPLINKGAPPIQQMGTRFTSSFEPLYPAYVVPGAVSPLPLPFNPGMPWNGSNTGVPYGNPIIGFPYGNPYTGMPYYPGLGGGFVGNLLNNGFFNRPYIGAPYATPFTYFPQYYASMPILVQAPSYSYTWESTPGAPQAPPATFTSRGSVLSRPFWSGYAGTNMFGGFQAGAAASLPMVQDYESTTTFTPIPPSFGQSGQ